jgi:hypothetical protein
MAVENFSNVNRDVIKGKALIRKPEDSAGRILLVAGQVATEEILAVIGFEFSFVRVNEIVWQFHD